MRQLCFASSAIVLAMAAGSASAVTPVEPFVLLGGLEQGGTSAALGVSRDGLTVVGSASFDGDSHAFLWRFATGMIDLTPETGGLARAVSGDGSVVVGFNNSGAFRWTQVSGPMTLGSLAGPGQFSDAIGVSGDGRFTTGFTSTPSGTDAYRYDHNTGQMMSVGGFEGRAISDDGATIAGYDFVEGAPKAFLWGPSETTPLGTLGGGFQFSEPIAMTPDASVVVGRTSSDRAGFGNPEAFRWTSSGGMVGLGSLQPGSDDPFHTEATGVSADGSVVVGFQRILGDNELIAFLWTEDDGMRPLVSVLADYGIDVGGADLFTISGISGDGRTIVGLASINGSTQAYVVTIPAPAHASWLAPIAWRVGRRRR